MLLFEIITIYIYIAYKKKKKKEIMIIGFLIRKRMFDGIYESK